MVFHGDTGVGADDGFKKGIFHLSLVDEVTADHVGSCCRELMGEVQMHYLSEIVGVVR